MGGSSKKTKIGNAYFYGFILIPVRQHDAILEIEMSKNSVWTGRVQSGRIPINKPDAFGGDEREGGVVGNFDIQDGANDQAVNDYYLAAKGAAVSALRGCVSIVARKPYISANTARLPSIRTKHVNITGIHRGWEPQTAIISPDSKVDNKAIYICMGQDNGMGAEAYDHMVEGLAAFFRSLIGTGYNNDIYLRAAKPQGNTVTIERFNCGDADYEEIALFVEGIPLNQTNLTVNQMNLTDAPAFFETSIEEFEYLGPILGGLSAGVGRSSGVGSEQSASGKDKHIIIINSEDPSAANIIDANAVIDQLGTVVVLAIALPTGANVYPTAGLAQVDNFSGDFVVEADSAQVIEDTINGSFISWADCNPAHLSRCFWTDPMRGGIVDDIEIGDSFVTAANLFFDEGLGFSPKFRGLDQADADRVDVERHADCMSFRSNKTGKIEIVPIRNDYVVADLMVLDSDMVLDWSGLSRPRASEIPNQLTVKYTRRDGKTGSVTRSNPAGVRRQGRVIPAQDVAYPSCTSEELAIRLCLRDLGTVTTDIMSGTLPLKYLPPDLEPGSVVIINEPLLNIRNMIMRVSETRIGQYDDASAWITVAEDKFATTQAVTIETITPGASNTRAALPVIHRLVTEADRKSVV